MLAITPTEETYLSAEALKIRPDERKTLIEVRNDLASGRVRHIEGSFPAVSATDDWVLDRDSPLFNMGAWAARTDCGTAHCIGGFMAARGCYGEFGDDAFNAALSAVFAPHVCSWGSLTPAQAVLAIDAFLAGSGADCWKIALEG